MANEYLTRVNTSTGNKKVYTWSAWLKLSYDGSSGLRFFGSGPSEAQGGHGYFGIISDALYIVGYDGAAYTYQLSYSTTELHRDYSGWMHILIAYDSTETLEYDRLNVYQNGKKIGSFANTQYPSANANDYYNTQGSNHCIGRRGLGGDQYEGQIFDLFWVDGQALTPDVFGFYKEGKGYISAGSTQSTDFRPGQWVPKAPRTIKSEINRKGGFGVNGFYLPMNDSSNFGADFHTTPNSIITLKGEDLPQPRNGAPTTTDAYVSQLREDPYAANLVLAVPGISTATGANLITNGNFESDISGWTASGVQFTHTYNSVGGNTSGKLMYFATGTNTTRSIYQNVTTETGKRYTLTFDASSDTASANTVKIDGTDVVTVTDNNNSAFVHHNVSFTAASTSTEIKIESTVSNRSYFDNVVVKQEDAPRDYSADIKGSGTNKTLTANGNAGVGYEIPSYYGSAMSFDGSGDYFQLTDNGDFNASGDFTIEFWANLSLNDANAWLFSKWNSGSNQREYTINVTSGGRVDFYWSTDGTTHGSIQTSAGLISADQWNHYVWEKNGSVLTGYINGVAVVVKTDLTSQYHNSSNPVYIGSLGGSQSFDGQIQDLRVYKGVAKYKGGFDVPKPYTPVGIGTWRAVPDTTANNFATLNSINNNGTTLSNGNLTVDTGTTNGNYVNGNIALPQSGKWYWEIVPTTNGDKTFVGIDTAGGGGTTNVAYFAFSGNKYVDGVPSTYGDTYTDNDVIGIAANVTSNTITFYKNGVSQGDISYNISGINTTYFPRFADGTGATGTVINVNFGQNPTFSGNTTAGTYTDDNGKGLFKYEPPTGFLALCGDNLPTPAIANPGEHFKTVLWTGDGNDGRSITGIGFTPDFVWVKGRNATEWHNVYDVVRGPNRSLYPNSTYQEESITETFNSFDTDGFSVSYNSAYSSVFTNKSGTNYVAWCWKAGGAAVSNTDGSVTSQVSANQDVGFSIVSYTGSSSAITVGHELGKKPNMILFKNRDQADKWAVYHSSVGATKFLSLNETAAATTASSYFNDTEPTSSVFTVNQTGPVNQNNERYIAYCWAEVEGFSKFGSYVGNGNADGPFVYCGFKPAFVLAKRTDNTDNWCIFDSSRDSQNPAIRQLRPNGTDTEDSMINSNKIDLLSNGFKHRTTGTRLNASGGTYIFAAFAESPFTTANAK